LISLAAVAANLKRLPLEEAVRFGATLLSLQARSRTKTCRDEVLSEFRVGI